MRHRYITIEGNIGVGKTTFSKMLSKSLGARLILEEFADNPFLPKFYKHPERYAFSLELFFLAERYRQLGEIIDQDLFTNGVVSDYFLLKSKLFAQNNLNDDELLLFDRLSDIILNHLPKPDLILYLHSDVKRLQKNIKDRGREYEQDITDEYLLNIQDKYLDYFRKQDEFPVVIVDVTEIDFVNNASHFEDIKAMTQKDYAKGIHRVVKT